ncbi:MAG: hypothetical protein IJ443_09975 [Firmicutes bacterium]|nr:hypothetical protein [Bacillota bacterium]
MYRTYLTTDAASLNAHNQVETQLEDVFPYVQSTLWIRVPDDDGMGFHWIGNLAADLPEQIDPLTWQVTLRDEACWQNGEALTVDDLIYSWQMLIDPNMVNSMANFFWYYIDIKNAEAYFNGECDWEDVGIEKIDDKTFRIITESEATQTDVMNNFIDRSMYPVYKDSYEAGMNSDRTETSYGTKLEDFVGCGPYIFETWTPDSVHVYKKNPDHWLADYYNYDTVEVYIVGEDNAKMQMFNQGQLDYYSPSSDTIDSYIEDPRLLSYGSTEVEHIDVNCKNSTNPISGSINYRRALYFALNREVIADKCFGHMEPAGYYINNMAGLLSDSKEAYRDTSYGKATTDLIDSWGPYGYNVEMAREYLAKAYEECGVPEDTVITLKLVFNSVDTNWKKTAEFIQQEWPEVFEGKIQIEIQNYSGITSIEFKEGNDDGWDLIPNTWSRTMSRNYPYTAFYYYLSTYDGSPNNFFSERFEEQYAICESTSDYEEQLAETQKLEEIYLEEVIQVPVVQYTNFVLYSDRVQLPMKQYVPGFGWGTIFGDIVE